MGRKRKTFDIAELLYTVNTRNQTSTCDPAVRQGWNSLLESVLHSSDLYDGYDYIRQEQLRESAVSSLPGISYEDMNGVTISSDVFYSRLDAENERRRVTARTSVHSPSTGEKRVFPDDSRRRYYVHHSVREAYQALERKHELEAAAQRRIARKALRS